MAGNVDHNSSGLMVSAPKAPKWVVVAVALTKRSARSIGGNLGIHDRRGCSSIASAPRTLTSKMRYAMAQATALASRTTWRCSSPQGSKAVRLCTPALMKASHREHFGEK